MFDYCLHERSDIVGFILQVVLCNSLAAVRPEHRGIQVAVVGPQVKEQLQNLVVYLHRACIFSVYLINKDNQFQVKGQRFLEHKPGLGQGTFGRIHQEYYAVHHGESSLHLATEIGMPRGVQDIYLYAVPPHLAVLG